MASPESPLRVKLMASIIFREGDDLPGALERLTIDLGEPEVLSQVLNFELTGYYYGEMGRPLKRRFASFRGLFPRDSLPLIKEKVTLIEEEFSKGGKRRFNIDPGFISRENLILATYKASPHRIYLGRGVYADLTLIFRFGSFEPLDWTYPDYREWEVIEFMNTLRGRYLDEVKGSTEGGGGDGGR